MPLCQLGLYYADCIQHNCVHCDRVDSAECTNSVLIVLSTTLLTVILYDDCIQCKYVRCDWVDSAECTNSVLTVLSATLLTVAILCSLQYMC